MFSEADWTAAGMDATEYCAKELKATLEGLAKKLFGDVECRWIDTYFPFTVSQLRIPVGRKGAPGGKRGGCGSTGRLFWLRML